MSERPLCECIKNCFEFEVHAIAEYEYIAHRLVLVINDEYFVTISKDVFLKHFKPVV